MTSLKGIEGFIQVCHELMTSLHHHVYSVINKTNLALELWLTYYGKHVMANETEPVPQPYLFFPAVAGRLICYP